MIYFFLMDFLGNLPICLPASESLWGLLCIPALDTKMFTLNSLPVTSPVKADLLRISEQLYPGVSNYGRHKQSPLPQAKKTVMERKLQSLRHSKALKQEGSASIQFTARSRKKGWQTHSQESSVREQVASRAEKNVS